MYDDTGYFDPSPDPSLMGGAYLGCPPETCSSSINNGGAANLGFSLEDPAVGLDHLQHHFRLDLEPSFHGHLMQEAGGAAPDLLNLLHAPMCGAGAPPPPPPPPPPVLAGGRVGGLPTEAFAGELPSAVGEYAAAAPSLLRDLFHSLPQNYGLFYGAEEREGAAAEGVGDVFREGEGGLFEEGVFDFRKEGRGKGKGSFPTEKQRRAQINEKYDILKLLVPNPTKADRASVVSDTIDYINELKRTIEELTILVENKKHGRSKRRKTEDEAAAAAAADMESSSLRPLAADVELPFAGSLRSSWLQRRSKETFVDVRIVDDEVNVKVTRRKKPNCLLLASRAIEDLRLDLLHASGGHIGDCYVFMFNTKISEGSSVYASAVAKKLLEAMDRPAPASPLRF